jgi:flavin-dependent dehydrogenase
LISRRLNLRRKDARLAKAAVFAHYAGAIRDGGIDEGATLVVDAAGNRGWFWYVPLSRDRASVGLVASPSDLLEGRSSPEKVLEEEIGASVEMRRRLAKARRATRVNVLRDFSHRAERCAGDGWVLVGDAFGFLDPIYFSGVFLALKSAELAADRVEEALESGDLSGVRLGEFGHRFSRGLETIHKLVYAFYAPGFSFARFVHEYPEHRARLVDILAGDVFKEGVEGIFQDLAGLSDFPHASPLEPPHAPVGA